MKRLFFMKKMVLLLLVSLLAQLSFAAFPRDSAVSNHQTSSLPQQKNALLLLRKMTIKEYEHSTGRKLTFAEKLGFKLWQRKLRKEGDEEKKEDAGSAIGGFLLGFFLLYIGVGIAFLVHKNKTLRKWALIGFGVVLLLALFILSLILSGAIPFFI